MEAVINDYFSRELVQDALLPCGNETALFESGILDSLAPPRLAMFIQEQFGTTVHDVDLDPENFDSVDAICSDLRYRVSGRADRAGARG